MRDQYPRIYNIVRKGSVFVSVVLRANPLNISFRRSLASNNLLDWHHLVARVISVQDDIYYDKTKMIFILRQVKLGFFILKRTEQKHRPLGPRTHSYASFASFPA